jgi:putative DNA primase/helicase
METIMIFSSTAPLYWARKLPALPLVFQGKRPAISDWSRLHEIMPTDAEMAAWVAEFGEHNVGLALGKQSGLCMIDIDTDDPAEQKAIQDELPDSPWCRIGAKGMMLAFKFSGVPTFRIKDVTGRMIVEHLSSKTQIVLPPSIHPTTKRPYVANCNLVDVLDKLMPLPEDIEVRLRSAIKKTGVALSHSGWTKVTEYVSVGSRDVRMASIAGLFAHGVIRAELTVKDAVERLRAWHSLCPESVAGDDIDVEKGVQNLVKFIRRDVVEKNKALPVGWDKDLTAEEKERLGLDFSADQEEWDHDRIRGHLRAAFEEFPPETRGRLDAIDYALKKIANATSMGATDLERLLRYISEAGGMKIGVPALRRRIKELNSDGFEGADHTEIAQATIKELELIAPLAFHAGRFMKWNGSHWEEKKRSEILRVIAEKFGAYVAGRRNSDHKGVLDVMSNLLPHDICTLSIKGINFANGFLTEELVLVRHDPAFGQMYTLPYRYVPEEADRAFRFNEFLTRCWSKDTDFKQKVEGLQEAICATIFSVAPRFQRAFLFYGPGKTGKSQLLNIIQYLVPDAARSYCPPDRWHDRFAPSTMLGSIINICGELPDHRPIDGQMFKAIVVGEEQLGERKGRDHFPWRPTCSHWFASNHLPKTRDTSSAFNRRWMIFTFSSPITDAEKVLDLGESIVAEEREAIVAWAVMAFERLAAKREYTLSTSHTALPDEVANANNSVRDFFCNSSRLVFNPTAEVTDQQLFQVFSNHAMSRHLTLTESKGFRIRAKQLAPEFNFTFESRMLSSGHTELFYRGIGLTPLSPR